MQSAATRSALLLSRKTGYNTEPSTHIARYKSCMEQQGTLIGERYRLQRLLGEGGMAEVWLGVDERMQRAVAIKLLRPQYAKDQALLERFRREAEIVAQLNSPHIVQVYDVGQSASTSFIVMEYVEGQDLKELLRFDAPLPVERALQLLRDIAEGVGVAHHAGLIHRDLKPGNVLLSQRGDVKVTDFGVARQIAGAALTEPGTVWGTSHYLAPEQARGATLSPASDVYALGVILFEMLTGALPFTSDDPVAVAIAHIQEPPPDVQTLNPGVPAGVAHLVARLLSKAPERRPADGKALVKILDSYKSGSGSLTTVQPTAEATDDAPAPRPVRPMRVAERPVAPPPPSARPAPPTRAVWIGGGIIAALALCVLVGAFALRRPDNSAAESPGGGSVPTATTAPTVSITVPVVVAGPGTPSTTATLSPEPSTASATATLPPESGTPTATATLPPEASPEPSPSLAPPSATATLEPTAEPTATLAPILLPDGPNGPNAIARLREQGIQVDGSLNDWEGITSIPIANVTFQPENWSGLPDLSGQARFAWNGDALYLAIDRADDLFVQNTEGFSLYLGDSVELWLDTDLLGDQNVAENDGDDFFLAFSPGDFNTRRAEGVIYYPTRDASRHSQLEVRAITNGGAGYTMEARIPWALLGVEPFETLGLGYAVGLNDNDDPTVSEQQTQITSTPLTPFRSPQRFGYLILAP